MRSYDFETYDVFTDKRFTGNQLAVVMDAQGLSTEDMQTITREFNLAETTFVLPPENSDHTARVRIFTIGYEMPFAGHPTVGTSIALAKARSLTESVTLELNTGIFPVRLDVSGEVGFAEFQNPNLPEEAGGAPSTSMLEKALSLPAGVIDSGDHRPRKIGAGANYVFAHAGLDDVRKAKVNSTAFEAMALEETVGVLLYAKGGEAADADYHVRMFAPGAGIVEDAATGSAAAALPGQIARSEKLADGAAEWRIEQGFEMGRPSLIQARITAKDRHITSVRIGGRALLVQRGKLFI
ncbi:MAG: phenazine biosynthesis protein PhzF [Hyphococcus sp.]|nr:MAG: phenazine biosynthesis protein PhzF [Marinicaulis sp.]